jgi:hypothetical protein
MKLFNIRLLGYVKYLENPPLYILWVGVCDSKIGTQPGKTQGIVGAGSIRVEFQVILCIVRKMVDLDVTTHLQQLV